MNGINRKLNNNSQSNSSRNTSLSLQASIGSGNQPMSNNRTGSSLNTQRRGIDGGTSSAGSASSGQGSFEEDENPNPTSDEQQGREISHGAGGAVGYEDQEKANDEGNSEVEEGENTIFGVDDVRNSQSTKVGGMAYRSYGGDAEALKGRSFAHSFALQPIFGGENNNDHSTSRQHGKKKASDDSKNDLLPQISGADKKSIKKPRRDNGDEFNSDNDEDDLTPAERKFLRQVATGNEDGALDSIQSGVNIHVKNTFER